MLGWEVIPRIPLGNLSVSPHGVGIAIGYFVGATMMARRARRTGFDEDHAWNAAVVGILGAIVGARVAYVIGHSSDFSEPLEYLQIYKGGISLMGGLIGGFLAAFVYCRAKKLDFLRLADMGAAGLALGTAIGRIGDLVIGDHLGKTTDGFWGWEYKGGELISSPPCDPNVYPSPDGCIQPGMVVHQTALYDSIWALVIFLVILLLERGKTRPKGFLIFTWAAMYSVGRILTDFTRVDKTWFGTGLTGSQLTAIVALLLSLFFLRRISKAKPAAEVAGDEDTGPDGPVEEPVVEGHTVAISAGREPVSEVPEAVAEEAAAAEVPPEPQTEVVETAPAEPLTEVIEAAPAEPVGEAVEPAPAEVEAQVVEVTVVPDPADGATEPAETSEPAVAQDPEKPEVVVPVEPVDPEAPEAAELAESTDATSAEPAPEAGDSEERQEP